MIMKNLDVRKGEEDKLFFLDTKTVLEEKNLRIFYVTLNNLLKIAADSALQKAPDPRVHLIGFSVRIDAIKKSGKSEAAISNKSRKKSRSRKSHRSRQSSKLSSKRGSFRDKLLNKRKQRSIKIYQMRENSITG